VNRKKKSLPKILRRKRLPIPLKKVRVFTGRKSRLKRGGEEDLAELEKANGDFYKKTTGLERPGRRKKLAPLKRKLTHWARCTEKEIKQGTKASAASLEEAFRC